MSAAHAPAPARLDPAVTCIDCHSAVVAGLEGDGMVDCPDCGAAYDPTAADLAPEPGLASVRAQRDASAAAS